MARTPPVFPTEAPGNFVTGALWNATVGAAGAWHFGTGSAGPPRFQAYGSTNQSIASGSGAFTSCTLDTEIVDSDGGHSTTTNTSRYVVQVPGTYLCIASVGYTSSSTGNRAVRVGVNGAAAQASQLAQGNAGTNSWYGIATAWIPLNAGDYVECQTWQTSGGALVTNGGAQLGPTLTCLWYSN